MDSKRKPITKCDRQSGNIPYYGATGIQDYVKDYIFDGRYLLVGEDGAKWGKNDNTAYIIEGKSWVNNHAHILKMHDDAIDAYVRYFLNGKDLNCYITGAIVQKLTQAALVNIPIPLPPLETQSRIVAELDLLQAIIDKQKAQLAELDNLAQCIFYDMFGDPVDNDKGWEVKKLGEVCEIIAGGDKPEEISNIKTKDYCYPVIANGDGDKGILGYCRTKRVSCDAVTIGARGASIGNCRIVSGGFTPVVRLIVLMPNESVNCTYLFFFAKQMPYYSNGAGQAQLTVPNVRDVSFILPPLSLQQTFAAKIESIEKQKAAISQSIAETQKLFNFTMDKYFG